MLMDISADQHATAEDAFAAMPLLVWATGPSQDVLNYSQGEVIVHVMGLGDQAFVVSSGEVVIMQNGRPVDLIEAGEYFDESIWLGAEAIALSDCRLVPVVEPQMERLAQ